MRYTAEAIAQIKGLKYDEILRVTTENAHRLLDI